MCTADMVLGKAELMKPVTCGVRVGEIDGERVALLGDGGADVDVA